MSNITKSSAEDKRQQRQQKRDRFLIDLATGDYDSRFHRNLARVGTIAGVFLMAVFGWELLNVVRGVARLNQHESKFAMILFFASILFMFVFGLLSVLLWWKPARWFWREPER